MSVAAAGPAKRTRARRKAFPAEAFDVVLNVYLKEGWAVTVQCASSDTVGRAKDRIREQSLTYPNFRGMIANGKGGVIDLDDDARTLASYGVVGRVAVLLK